MRYLTETWGGRDNSWARFPTRFEQMAQERGKGRIAVETMKLYGLTPEEVERRMAVAPTWVQERHKVSFKSRRLVGDDVTQQQDARDVLLVMATHEVRYSRPPYPEWVGLETEPRVLAGQLERLGALLDEAVSHGTRSDVAS